MEQLNVGGSYEEILKRLTPSQYVREPRPGTFETAQPFVVPPLNTDIRFSSHLPPKHLSDTQYLTVAASPLPEQWDWRNDYDIDDAIVKKKKAQLTKVPNQGLCGSCWAVAVAGLVGDLFVTSGIVRKNPQISSTYSLSCYPQYMCGGGNPAELLNSIAESGVASDSCVDYSWCNNDSVCSGKGSQHFNPSTETERINGLIPPCGCSRNAENRALYFVKDAFVVSMENDNHDVAPLIKSHIFRVGPVVGGYHVFKNFMSGNYTATGGVYFENYDYETNQWLTPAQSPEWVGSHAIVVVGWGLSPIINIPLPDGRAHDVQVPYWYCRNSWGDSWGFDSGYFRIAMYPYNKRSQFERLVVIQPQNMLSGGFMLCYPDRVEIRDAIGNIIKQRIASDDFEDNVLDQVSNTTMYTWMIIVLIIIIGLVALYILLKMKKNKH